VRLRAFARRAALFIKPTRLPKKTAIKVGNYHIFSYIIYINKKVMNYKKLLVLLLTWTIVSCTKENVKPPLCPDGNCDGSIFAPYPKDSNGYYHVDLDFSSEYLPRFDIFIEADDVDPFYFYNDMGVVQAAFESQSFWTLENGVEVNIVQETTIYLNNSPQNTEYTPSSSGRKWAKRIVGPIPPEFIGDTLVIRAEIYWDGGSKVNSQLFVEKFIIE
tara:strand:+ start:1475 stop:2125 length:651 start_codon:yes stop_codon:yes gene_type:complete